MNGLPEVNGATWRYPALPIKLPPNLRQLGFKEIVQRAFTAMTQEVVQKKWNAQFISAEIQLLMELLKADALPIKRGNIALKLIAVCCAAGTTTLGQAKNLQDLIQYSDDSLTPDFLAHLLVELLFTYFSKEHASHIVFERLKQMKSSLPATDPLPISSLRSHFFSKELIGLILDSPKFEILYPLELMGSILVEIGPKSPAFIPLFERHWPVNGPSVPSTLIDHLATASVSADLPSPSPMSMVARAKNGQFFPNESEKGEEGGIYLWILAVLSKCQTPEDLERVPVGYSLYFVNGDAYSILFEWLYQHMERDNESKSKLKNADYLLQVIQRAHAAFTENSAFIFFRIITHCSQVDPAWGLFCILTMPASAQINSQAALELSDLFGVLLKKKGFCLIIWNNLQQKIEQCHGVQRDICSPIYREFLGQCLVHFVEIVPLQNRMQIVTAFHLLYHRQGIFHHLAQPVLEAIKASLNRIENNGNFYRSAFMFIFFRDFFAIWNAVSLSQRCLSNPSLYIQWASAIPLYYPSELFDFHPAVNLPKNQVGYVLESAIGVPMRSNRAVRRVLRAGPVHAIDFLTYALCVEKRMCKPVEFELFLQKALNYHGPIIEHLLVMRTIFRVINSFLVKTLFSLTYHQSIHLLSLAFVDLLTQTRNNPESPRLVADYLLHLAKVIEQTNSKIKILPGVLPDDLSNFSKPNVADLLSALRILERAGCLAGDWITKISTAPYLDQMPEQTDELASTAN